MQRVVLRRSEAKGSVCYTVSYALRVATSERQLKSVQLALAQRAQAKSCCRALQRQLECAKAAGGLSAQYSAAVIQRLLCTAALLFDCLSGC